MNNCPCGSSSMYEQCCKPIHQNIHNALTAESLMRSRYTAYTLGKIDYLMESHHSSTRPFKEKKEILKWAKSMHWIRLEILSTTNGLQNDIKGTVEFNAFYHDGKQVQRLHENSSFVKEHDHWVYKSEV